jgi:hypothetical protein
VESWAPGYGASTEDQQQLGRSSAEVNVDVEVPESRWRPIEADPGAPDWPVVAFVDGVRRIDAMAWMLGPGPAGDDGEPGGDGGPGPGEPGSEDTALALCASYAAGVVCCCSRGAHLRGVLARRGLFCAAGWAGDMVTAAGRYPHMPVPAGDPSAPVGVQELSLAVQRALGAVEAEVAASAPGSGHACGGSTGSEELLVVDGPLHGRAHLPDTLGYVKTHNKEYLPAGLHRMVGALTAGQRTPVFGLGTSWQRYSWYLKLPGGAGAPWAGVVRVECSAELSVAESVALAGRSQPMLCRYASTEYKDSRAPQNLYPIAGLERLLRRRLGDQALLYRAIRAAAG